MSLWPLSLSPPLCLVLPRPFIFPDRKSGLWCQAVSWGASTAVSGGGPHPELHSDGGVQRRGGHPVVLPKQTGISSASHVVLVRSKPEFTQFVSPHQTNDLVQITTLRESLSQATMASSALTIHSVNVTDTGRYSCNVTGLDGTYTQQTQVVVHGKTFFFFCPYISLLKVCINHQKLQLCWQT